MQLLLINKSTDNINVFLRSAIFYTNKCLQNLNDDKKRKDFRKHYDTRDFSETVLTNSAKIKIQFLLQILLHL